MQKMRSKLVGVVTYIKVQAFELQARALRMAGITNPNTEIDFFDVYSCFPIAVEIACDELGIDFQTLGKPLTVTGGLPFHGGPGNNYVGHSICKMIEVLRHEKAKKTGCHGFSNGKWWIYNKTCIWCLLD